LKIFENSVPQFPKKEVKGSFRQLNNKHHLAESVPSVACPPWRAIFATANPSAGGRGSLSQLLCIRGDFRHGTNPS